MDSPKRKPNRLEHYDYSQNGAYFVTLCVRDKAPILSRITVGASIARPPVQELSAIGKIAEEAILKIPIHYPNVAVDHYVIMPNHVHLLLRIDSDDRRAMLAPTISRVIQQTKGYITKQCGMAIWQKSYYDHIIRDEVDYNIRWKYIDENPVRWCNDEFYTTAE